MSDFASDHAAWAAARLAALTADDGWLHLTDRIEIAPGRYRVGTAADNDLVISAGPAHLGLLDLPERGAATFDSGAGPEEFVPAAENPPQLQVARLLLEVTQLDGQAALRVRDLAAPARAEFPGIDYYPLDPGWRITAAWDKLDQAETLGIGMITGVGSSVQLTHRARFEHAGQEVVLLPTHWKSGKPMFVIRDATSGAETYGASRFLIGEVEGDRVILDFNRAFNPPCAYTDHAVCPLPPRQNILDFPIRAGETKPL